LPAIDPLADSPSLRDENVVDRTPHNDKPISTPSEDRFDIDPFAKTLASSIRKLASPEGTVIALNGPWGSGKSSAVNLVLHHLRDAIEANEIAVINFACWWFRGEEELALAFFRELYAGLGASVGDRFKRVLPKIGARLLRAGAMVGPGIDLVGGGGAGSVAAGAMNWLSGLIQQDDTVEKLHAELANALADQKKRFLIVIDDIDRLGPDEALLIFRLVKSVGRLPNMIYLLVFDRQLAESIVAEKYPTEGPHYLEKIIQAGFDIPEPRQDDLRQELLEILGELCGSPNPNEDQVRFMNIFYDVVAPEIKIPRDLIRLGNSLAVTWPAVSNDVDRADFIGVEVLRVLRPNVYRALRANKERLCGVRRSMVERPQQQQREECDKLLLGSVAVRDQERLRHALMRLFPPLSAIWSNVVYGEHSMGEWSRERRVCASEHFDSYFRFSIGSDVLPKDEIDQLVARASDREFIARSLRECLATSADAEKLCNQAVLRIRAAAESGELGAHPQLGSLLYRWRDLAGNDGAEVKQWTGAQLSQDDMIVKLAKAFTSHGWSHSVSDTVAKRTTLANIPGVELIMDKDRLRARVEELASKGTLPEAKTEIVVEFLEAWRRHDRNERG
jgi:predicted KAP-like P-loop ATPase